MIRIEPTFTDDFGDITALKFSSDKPEVSSINPSHYRTHPSGVECIQITEHMGFNLGNCVKYIWRADLKNNDGGTEDLKKASWYIERELNRRATE